MAATDEWEMQKMPSIRHNPPLFNGKMNEKVGKKSEEKGSKSPNKGPSSDFEEKTIDHPYLKPRSNIDEKDKLYKTVKIINYDKEIKNYTGRRVIYIYIDFLNNKKENRKLEFNAKLFTVLDLSVGSEIVLYSDKLRKWVNWKVDYDETFRHYKMKYTDFYGNRYAY